MIQFHYSLVPRNLSFQDLEHIARNAEDLGFATISVGDHFPTSAAREQFEQWTTLAFIASRTSKIRIGSLVTNSNFRPPALLAKTVATVDQICNGRLTFGIAAGGNSREEYTASGYQYLEPSDRIEKLGELVKILKLLWTLDIMSFDGKYFKLENAVSEPKPLQKPTPPIWIGQDKSSYTFKIVAESADAVNMHCNSVEHARSKLRILEKYCKQIGRKVEEILIVPKHFVVIEESEDELQRRFREDAEKKGITPAELLHSEKKESPDAIIGTTDECVQIYESYIQAGFTHFTPIVLPNYGRDAIRYMDLFARKVMERVRDE